eukprot:m.262539 g.262539  ORF g.262539 m.262539 type:complete len:164 (-) comp25576_c0_seq1:64-555(-)
MNPVICLDQTNCAPFENMEQVMARIAVMLINDVHGGASIFLHTLIMNTFETCLNGTDLAARFDHGTGDLRSILLRDIVAALNETTAARAHATPRKPAPAIASAGARLRGTALTMGRMAIARSKRSHLNACNASTPWLCPAGSECHAVPVGDKEAHVCDMSGRS